MKPSSFIVTAHRVFRTGEKPERPQNLGFMLGLGQAKGTLSLFPLTAFLEKFHAFETFQNGALAAHGTRSFETGMFGHNFKW